jgi:hypothetical protein
MQRRGYAIEFIGTAVYCFTLIPHLSTGLWAEKTQSVEL